MKEVHVTAAVIINENKILCVQRNENKYDYISKKWEFPGGKVEENEQLEETIRREIQEELNLIIEARSFLIQVNHQYPDFKLKMDTFICEIIDGKLKLNEHIDYKWLTVEELSFLDWAAADLPIVEKLSLN
ncbi:MAG: (deoxy)nucleoside triphosphate pyrophosphohydrolase [Flavobacteriales bacterium]|nr:(deoxy)nucleoside triphosphate pyrophosphohydrolase [Flavobacteriales bacterium]